MRIIYDNQIFSNQIVGGPSRYFVELIKELIKLNNTPLIVSPIDNNIYLEEINKKFKKKINFKVGKKNLLTLSLNKLISKFYFFSLNYDLYHLTYYDNCFTTKKPKVITVYDLIHEKYFKEFNLDQYPKKKIFKEIDHFLCISNNTKKDLINYYGIDDKKITVTYLANSIVSDNLSKNNFNRPFFLFVGSRKRYKNFNIILEAYSKMPEVNKNYDIVCFGGGKFIMQETQSMKKLSLNLENIHHIEGSDKVLSSLYRYAEALIYPSKYEGFGIPILEAMSMGCPVISSNSSSLPEVYGNAALNFFPDSVDGLIDSMTKIISDSELKKSQIKKGYERVKNFSWKKCAIETNELYKRFS
jgi:glycosyltransferase involved in cell wall biosynthesis